MFVRDDVRRIMGIHNPEKDEALKELGDMRGQIGELLQ